MQKYLFILIIFLFGTPAIGQEKITAYSDQYWFQYYGQLAMNEKISLLYDGGIRYKYAFKEKVATLGRMGIQYKLGKKWSVAAGGAYFTQYTSDKLSREEWRGWEETQFKHQWKRLYSTNRLRFEQRNFHYLSTGKNDYTNRIRIRAQLQIPLNKKTMDNNTLFFVLADELFFEFGKNITYNFNHNRAITGLGFKFNDDITINLFYTSIYTQKNSAILYEYSDMVWFNLQHTLRLKKKAKKDSNQETKTIEKP